MADVVFISNELEILLYSIYAVATFTQLYIGLYLFSKFKQNSLKYLQYLSFSFLFLSFSFICSILRTLFPGTLWEIIFILSKEILQLFGVFMLMFFANHVFHQKNQKGYSLLKTSLIISGIFVCVSAILRFYYFPDLIFYLYQAANSYDIAMPGLYMGYYSIKEHSKLKGKLIETWILKRYLMAGIASLIFAFQFLPTLAFSKEGISRANLNIWEVAAIVILAITIMLYSFFAFIAWVMPSFVKNNIKQKQQLPNIENFSEEDFEGIKNNNNNKM